MNYLEQYDATIDPREKVASVIDFEGGPFPERFVVEFSSVERSNTVRPDAAEIADETTVASR